MKDIQERVTDVLNELSEVISELVKREKELEPDHKAEQLRAIQNSIDLLETNKTPVPEALLKLKLEFVEKLNLAEEYNEIKLDIKNSMLEIVEKLNENEFNVRSRTKKSGKRIYVSQLVQDGLIKPNTPILGRTKTDTYRARINEKGMIVVKFGDKEVEYDNPTNAATEVIGRFRNGWDWWQLDGDTNNISLDEIRTKYRQNEA